MFRNELTACLIVLALPAALGAQPQVAKRDWTKLSNLQPGQVIEITAGGRETIALFVLADSASLVIADLSSPDAKSGRGPLAAKVRGNPAQAAEAAIIEANGHRAPVLRVSRCGVGRVTREVSRSSKAAVAAASVAGAVVGLYAGAFAGLAAGGGPLGDDDGGALVAFVPIAVGVPLAAGLGMRSATRRVTREVVYEAGGGGLPLDQEGWRAVRGALPASLGGH